MVLDLGCPFGLVDGPVRGPGLAFGFGFVAAAAAGAASETGSSSRFGADFGYGIAAPFCFGPAFDLNGRAPGVPGCCGMPPSASD